MQRTFPAASLLLAWGAAMAAPPALPDPRLAWQPVRSASAPASAAAPSWRQANDRVRDLGGHAGHLRGAPRAASGVPR